MSAKSHYLEALEILKHIKNINLCSVKTERRFENIFFRIIPTKEDHQYENDPGYEYLECCYENDQLIVFKLNLITLEYESIFDKKELLHIDEHLDLVRNFKKLINV